MNKNFDIFSSSSKDLLVAVVNTLNRDITDDLKGLANLIGLEVQAAWQKQAMDDSDWGTKYASAIKIRYLKNIQGFAEVYIDKNEIDKSSKKPLSMFVDMTEEGVSPWSIKDALLESKKAKTNAKGLKYIIIPFRWRTPNKGQKHRSQFTDVMPQNVYKMIKGGGRLPKDESLGYMAGMVKYEKKHHSGYYTFRAISEKSEGWQHPGKVSVPVYKRVLAKVQGIIDKRVSEYVDGLLKNMQAGKVI